MKKKSLFLSPEQTVSDLAHLSWCALVALRTAQQDGKAQSPLTIHNFLLGWLVSAQKQRRFPRSVAADIESLVRLGRSRGLTADLIKRLKSLYESCAEPSEPPSDLVRLTHAIGMLKLQGWVNAVVTDVEWDIPSLIVEYGGTSALLVRKSELMRNFSDSGQLCGTVGFLVTGDGQGVTEVFTQQNLNYRMEDHVSGALITLHAAGC